MKRTRPGSGYVRAPQFELPLDGGFRLMQQTTIDGEREQRERDRDREARDSAQAAQQSLL